jgi:uncharacterized protein YicC (UPF0701 family)
MNTPSLSSQVSKLQREKDYAEEALTTLARTIGSEGLTWTRVVYDAVQKIEQGSKMLGMATNLNMELQNKADMWRDEFQRIRAMVYDSDLHTNSEIAAICDRAISDIRSNISLIDQREKAADEIARLRDHIDHAQRTLNAALSASENDQAELRP